MIYNFSLDDGFHQGEIYQDITFSCEDSISFFSVLLNPVCDLVIQEGRKKPKAEYFLFLGIKPADFIFSNILSSLKITKKQKNGNEPIDSYTYNDLISSIIQFINGNIYPRYVYIPPLEGYFGHSVVDLQLIESKKFSEELSDKLKDKKIASLKSSWKETIPNRFTSYSARIGVDNDYYKIIDSLFTDLKYNFDRRS